MTSTVTAASLKRYGGCYCPCAVCMLCSCSAANPWAAAVLAPLPPKRPFLTGLPPSQPLQIRTHPILLGEGLGGALYIVSL